MTIEDVILRIGEIGIIPVVRAATVDDATRAVEAICAGGIPILEITMTVPNATSVIRHVVGEHGKMALVGAGTVTTAEQAEACIRAGAEFIVSPGLSIDVLSVAPETPLSPCRLNSNGGSECCERCGLHRSRSLCSGGGRGSGERRRPARRESGDDHASRA